MDEEDKKSITSALQTPRTMISKPSFMFDEWKQRLLSIKTPCKVLFEKCIHQAMTELDLASQNIGNHGVDAFSSMSFSALILLDLQSNNIELQATETLVCCDSPSLKSLYLQNNIFSESGKISLTRRLALILFFKEGLVVGLSILDVSSQTTRLYPSVQHPI